MLDSALNRIEPWLDDVEELMARLAREMGGSPLGEIAAEHLATGGKRLRGRLALAAVEALGGAAAEALPWAAACELFHNATLIHDDLQDGDTVRRGQPTVWARRGMAQAVNAGDLMLLLPFLAVSSLPRPRPELFEILALRGSAVIAGQAGEIAMASSKRMGRDDYLRTIIGKTSGLFELPVEGAALLTGHDSGRARSLGAAFRPLGVLFQMQDDVLDLFGDKGRGAPGADLREGKVSALVVEHLGLHPEDRDWLLEVLRAPRHETLQHDVDTAIDRFRTGGALAAVCERIRELSSEAQDASVLRDVPSLRSLVCELSERVLLPIAHVMDS